MRGWKKTKAADANNPVVGDMYLEGGTSVALTNADDAIEATAQELRSRILLFRGSYFLDLREGVPWFQEILRKGYVPARVREIFRQTLLTHPAIADVPLITLSVDRATRAASLAFEARTTDGKVVSSEDFGPVEIR